MAKPISQLTTLKDGGKPKLKPEPTPTISKLSQDQLNKFGQFAGSGDTKEIAKYLMKKGLIGAEQLYTDHPDLSAKDGIINAQSDWKPSAISQMLIRARSLNLKTPTQVKANRAALVGALPDRYAQAISHPAFSNIHKNFWETFDGILSERYQAEKQSTPLTSLATSLAKK